MTNKENICPECDGTGGSGGDMGFAGWKCETCKGKGKVESQIDMELTDEKIISILNGWLFPKELKGKMRADQNRIEFGKLVAKAAVKKALLYWDKELDIKGQEAVKAERERLYKRLKENLFLSGVSDDVEISFNREGWVEFKRDFLGQSLRQEKE